MLTAKYSDIYASLLELGSGVVFETRWAFVKPDPEARVLPLAAEVLDQLRQMFSEKQLVASGVAKSKDKRLVLNPRLATADRIVIPVHNKKGDIVTIVSSAGSATKHVPLFAIHRDPVTAERLRKNYRFYFVAQSMKDVVLLQSLGFAATPAAELARLGINNLRLLLRRVGGSADGPSLRSQRYSSKATAEMVGQVGPVEDYEGAFALILLGRDLCQTTGESEQQFPDPELASVAKYLHDAETYLEIDFQDIYVLWLNAVELANLDFCLGLRSVELIRDLLLNTKSFGALEQFTDPSRPPIQPETFGDTFDKVLLAWMDVQANSSSNHQLEKLRYALQRYYVQIEKELFQPHLACALTSTNPESRSIRVILANISRLLHRTMPQIHVKQLEALDQTRGGDGAFLPSHLWHEIGLLTDYFVKLSNAEARLRKTGGSKEAPEKGGRGSGGNGPTPPFLPMDGMGLGPGMLP